MSSHDPRRIVGRRVCAKAIHVTALAECARRFGSRSKSKVIAGTVIECSVKKTATNRSSAYVKAVYNLGGGTLKTVELNVRSVLEEAPDPQDFVPEIRQEPGEPIAPPVDQINQPEDRNNVNVTPGTLTNATAVENLESVPMEMPNIPAEEVHPAMSDASSQLNDGRARHTVEAHDAKWFKDDLLTTIDVNGSVPNRDFVIKTPIGEMITKNSDRQCKYSRLQYFQFMFPPDEIDLIVKVTNDQLRIHQQQSTTTGEAYKFFGLWILATRFEFGSRASLWSNVAPSKFAPAPAFGKTGTSRHRFDNLWRHIRFSDQKEDRPEGMSSEKHRWTLVDDFVTLFNSHRSAMFVPGETICVDESISRWYGLGGEWINIGLPMCVAIDRKPDNGCEIQDAACGKSKIMIRLKLVKTATEEEANSIAVDSNGSLHGANVLYSLICPWTNTDRIVCADSYFASVQAAERLKRVGLRFIGVVKTATKRFPMKYLSEIEMQNRGDRTGLIMHDEFNRPTMIAFCWMDRNRRYFIASASSLSPGLPHIRQRWRQLETDDPNADPERVSLEVPQPKACEVYYNTCAAIDNHNRYRQSSLMMERKLGTKDWAMRINMSLVAICIVDAWLAYKQCTGTHETQANFYLALAEELIDNTYDEPNSTRARNNVNRSPSDPMFNHATGTARSGVSTHLTPTKKKRKTKDGCITNHAKQGYCDECGRKTKWNCSKCMDEKDSYVEKDIWLCHTEIGRTCFADHIAKTH